ncbi:hsp70-like protein [Dothidotthia symphoricarpi CBS 119687]|uniref:Hsp70-like protein n=1 Tax=Dothidotthia symphoricarpi CBS 119687 TaxID=1392245 RepID=A0A6A6AKT2_9PLEO|nr:hsp70-like protein [Dothidotthia symphoricarpi CBS 119687]KAF2131051.1 hsp70-like protein [Dothidotthia symphoricarpi CBS 119687]
MGSRSRSRAVKPIGSGFSHLSVKGNHRIIIGVDYGTTYTGISYIDSSNTAQCSIRDVHDVRTFPGPGKEANAVWKTPSRIAYSKENQGCTENQFGFQVTPKMISYSWTKLLLDQQARTTDFDDPSLKQSEGEGMLKLPCHKTATDVVTDFLSEIYDWTLQYLEKRVSPEILAVTALEFWFTVPAIWSDQAKDATLSAAMAAGFASGAQDRIFLVLEPEAAGVATLKGFSERNSAASVQRGDGVLICDCGGGTVDITSYSVLQVAPKLEFEEIVPGTGGKCGSTYIDREFHRWMSQTFGRKFDQLKFEKKGPGSRFMKEFECHKRDFGYSDNLLDQLYELNLVIPQAEDSEFYDGDESVVKLNGRTMLSFFEPVVKKIIALLNQQIDAANRISKQCIINRVVLVGGFGDSPYLNTQVRKWCQTKDIRLTCPEDPQAAIARGAALRGLDSIAPIRRRCRRHYGIGVWMLFREGIDPESSAMSWEWTGEKMCRSRIDWTIEKGQIIDEQTKISMPQVHMLYEREGMTQDARLYSCTSEVPPDYQWDPSVEKVAVLKHTLQQSHLEAFESKISDGYKCWKIEYTREVCLGSKEGTLKFRVVRDKEEWGSTEINFDTRGRK